MALPDFTSTTITLAALDTLFPMHTILDEDGVIIQVGQTLSKIMQRDLVGRDFLEVFTIKKPRSIRTVEQIRGALGQKIIVSSLEGVVQALEFRCVATRMGERGDQLLIDFTFSADLVDLVPTLNLSATDFKPNDFSLDLIYTIETQRTLVEDSHKLTLALEKSKKEAEHAANIDPLTGIANRRALYQFLEQEAAGFSQRGQASLLHIDLDKFKSINDSCGHTAGDAVLQHAASVLAHYAGETGFAARLGGDEFVLITPSRILQSDDMVLAGSIRHRLLEPIAFDGQILQVGASIGVVDLARYAASPPDQLLSYSDVALYEAKRTGEPIVALSSQMLRQHHERAALAHEIEIGLKDNQFVPFFQPKVDTRSGRVIGLEVLARWHHPTRGLILPAQFIEIAEAANLMGAIDRSIIKQAVHAYSDWQMLGLDVGRLSINLTGANLHSLTFVEYLLEQLHHSGLSPNVVDLELLESIIFDRFDTSLLGRCQQLRDVGFNLTLDDFGTGYASISTLIDNTISTIKIDRSFVSGIDKEPRLQRITRSILALCQQLGLEVIAEGVETRQELEYLGAMGCYLVQGYLICRPMPAQEMTDWLAQKLGEGQRETIAKRA